MLISIHAPTRGATCHISKRGIYYVLFQSTLPREERPTQPIIPMIHNNFNPRSHERSDTTCDRLARGSYDFNPRSHERSDNIDNQPNQQHTNFNPRSHERSDLINLTINIAASISIHAPTRGATCMVDDF